MRRLLTFGQMLDVHARLSPDRLGARDLDRSLTFGQWNSRARRLANALLGLGLRAYAPLRGPGAAAPHDPAADVPLSYRIARA